MSAITSSVSGLRAAEVQLSTSATNIANATTPNYKAVNYTQTTDNSGNVVPQSLQGDSDVSIEAQLLQAQQAINDFKANADALNISNNVQKHLIDILA